jgi:mono/diheme cytochrome c family protein
MKKRTILFVLILYTIFLNGCIYDFVAPEKDLNPVDTSVVISFAAEIQPAFTANCILCHKTGGTSPDLTAGNAYASINSSKYINASSPAQSLIYRRSSTSGGFSGHPTLTSAQAALLLGWIQQGAKNN